MIKAILIDIDDTLLDFSINSSLAIKEAFLHLGLKFTDDICEVFQNINREFWKKIESKEITLQQLRNDRWKVIFSRLNIVADGHKMEKEFLANLNTQAEKIQGAEELLEYLSSKYIVCSASNAPESQQIARLELSGLKKYITHQFISSRVGVDKPDAKFFEYCINHLEGINIDEVVMIGDSIHADIVGAKNFGIKTIWFNKDNITILENERVMVDYSVNNLLEIKEIL